MTERIKTRQALLFLTLTIAMFLQAQDQPDMTILFNYFDSTVTIYVDGNDIVIELSLIHISRCRRYAVC